MPPPSSRMTKNQDRTHRYRPGKAVAETYDDDSDSDEDRAPPAPKPSVTQPRRNAAGTPFPIHKKLPPAPIARAPEIDLEGFVTASESSEDEDEDEDDGESGSSGEEEDSTEAEDSESEEEVKPKLIAPKFLSKAQRAKLQEIPAKSEHETMAAEEAERQEKVTELLRIQIDRDQAARAAGKKAWDDDDEAVDDVDDRDGIDLEAEHAAWKLRELKRVKRDRLALVEKEKEREEIERRKNLTVEEREAEDRDLIEQQKADQEGRGKMGFMQKYFHKGAFFQGEEQDEEVKAALSRDLAGARFVDDFDKDSLPEYMRIRDMAQLGRKSRSKYKDLRAEDTGRWGDFNDKRSQHNGLDERFQADHGPSQTGANSAPLGIRRHREDDDAMGEGKRMKLA